MISNSLSQRIAKRITCVVCVMLAVSLLVCLTPAVEDAYALDSDVRSSLVDAFRSAQLRADAAVEYALAQDDDPLHALSRMQRSQDEAQALAQSAPQAKRALPSNYSLTSEGTVTYAKQQGIWNACWSFAEMGALESAILKYEKQARGTLGDGAAKDLGLTELPTQPDLSEHALAWYSYTVENALDAGNQAGEGVYREDRTSVGILGAGGNVSIASAKLFAQESITRESTIPYTYRQQTSNGYAFADDLSAMLKEETATYDWSLDESISRSFTDTGYRIDDIILLPNPALYEYQDDGHIYQGYNPAATEAIKETLLDTGAVSVDIMAESSVWWDMPTGEYMNYDEWCQYYDGDEDSNHRVAIVGWDDAYPASNFTGTKNGTPQGDGAWLVKNSWGSIQGSNLLGLTEAPEWGLRDAQGKGTGFFWVSYYDKSLGCPAAYQVEPLQSSAHHIYQYDYLGTSALSSVVCDAYPFASANIFTANNAEVLKAVSTYALTPDVAVDIEVYLLNDDDEVPTDGRRIRSQQAVLEQAGNYTLELDDPVQLAAGQRFAIVESVHDKQDEMYQLNLEVAYQIPEFYESNAVAHEGETMAYCRGTWMGIDEINAVLAEEGVALQTGNALIKAFTQDDPAPLLERKLQDQKSGIAVSGFMSPDAFLEVVPNQVHNPLDDSSSDNGSSGDSSNGYLDEGCTLVERARLAGHAITSANLNLSGEYGRDIQIEIPVEGLEGRTVTVVSCSNGAPELLTAEIKNGHATFRLKEPVPFALLDEVYTQDQIAAMEKADTPELTPPSQDSDQPENQPEDQPSGQPQDQFKEQSSLVGFSDNRTTSAQTSDSGMNAMMYLVFIALIAVFVLQLARSRKC